MTTAARDFWIDFNKFNDGTYDVYGMSEIEYETTPPAELIKVREITAESEAELAELRRDKARLEFILEKDLRPKKFIQGWRVPFSDTEKFFVTPRESIDAAMESEKK